MAADGLHVIDGLRGTARVVRDFPGGLLPSAPGHGNRTRPPWVVPGRDHDVLFLALEGPDGPVLATLAGGLEGAETVDRSTWPEGEVQHCIAPLAGADPAVIACVLGGRLSVVARDTGSLRCSSQLAGLSPDANLVADGDGRVYVWQQQGQSAGLHAFDGDCRLLFSVTDLPLPVGIRHLQAAPSGLFYALAASTVHAIEIQGAAAPALPTPLVPDTRYTAQGRMVLRGTSALPAAGAVAVSALGDRLALNDLEVPAGVHLVCRAGSGITLGAGFTVRRDGTLHCGITGAAKRAVP
jgi:hypothetical protein